MDLGIGQGVDDGYNIDNLGLIEDASCLKIIEANHEMILTYY